ncbi:hypothetical protein DAPPUDRAFT_327070 [Daphnia pulex]|uniref:Mitochondrial glycine transporter n=1 Tax=Daphnia pulex TaxID=6669 RepID=E9H9Q9_DAPPU|nr:hypothetical protein DAPPUDRAFT_327070 [Daphnia pulex]|eukprot:EFX71442.1 hypothetical protein DAPPUDRAFT_327070 [Daphnia pulex]
MCSTRKKRHVSFLGAFVSGASSGACSTVLFQPFDVVKTRLQENAAFGQSTQQRRGMIQVFGHIVQKEGPKTLWSGLIPSLWRCVPGVAIYFTSLEVMQSVLLEGGNQPLDPWHALVVAASARCVAGVLLMPFTVIKTRFESGHFKYKNVAEALSSIYRLEGGRGLMTGLGATLARDVPFSAVYYAVYTQLKQLQPGSTMGKSFSCGLVAGIVASVVTHPADVVKTSMQLFPSRYQHRTREAVLSVYRRLGVKGFFSGLMPRLVRRSLVSALSWTVYDKVREQNHFNRKRSRLYFCFQH